MDSFYSFEELKKIGFAEFGTNVKISRKASIYGAADMKIGSNVRIDDFCILSGKIEIGSYVHVAAYAALYGGVKGIFVGDFASISSRVTVYSLTDDYLGSAMTNPMVPEEYTNVESKSVHIGKHVIIGATSVVLPGVSLQEGSAFGSFSFITHDSEAWSVNIGIPAKKTKDRKRDILGLEQKMMEAVKD